MSELTPGGKPTKRGGATEYHWRPNAAGYRRTRMALGGRGRANTSGPKKVDGERPSFSGNQGVLAPFPSKRATPTAIGVGDSSIGCAVGLQAEVEVISYRKAGADRRREFVLRLSTMGRMPCSTRWGQLCRMLERQTEGRP